MNRLSSPRTFPNIKAITFDADDTLWDFQSAMKSGLESTLAQIRSIAPNAATEQLTVQKMTDIREEVVRPNWARESSATKKSDMKHSSEPSNTSALPARRLRRSYSGHTRKRGLHTLRPIPTSRRP